MKRLVRAVAGAAALLAGSATSAHTAWLVRGAQPSTWLLRFGGHQGKLEPAVASKLKAVTALDTRGRSLAVKRLVQGSNVRLAVVGQPSLIGLSYDNDIHTRPPRAGPTVERPMNAVPGATSATSAIKYGKTIVRWDSIATRPLDQPFEIIPQRAVMPIAGQPMRVQVRLNGRAAEGIKIGRGEDTADGTTDAQGMSTFVPRAGDNRLWAGKRMPVRGNPRFTELSYEYLLGFEARP